MIFVLCNATLSSLMHMHMHIHIHMSTHRRLSRPCRTMQFSRQCIGRCGTVTRDRDRRAIRGDKNQPSSHYRFSTVGTRHTTLPSGANHVHLRDTGVAYKCLEIYMIFIIFKARKPSRVHSHPNSANYGRQCKQLLILSSTSVVSPPVMFSLSSFRHPPFTPQLQCF